MMNFRPKLDGTYTPEQLAMIEAARALADIKRDLLRSLARRQAARPARQEAARKGAQKRRGM